MGARSIEAKLRLRLLAVIAPALVGVGAASVGVTAWVFDAADRRAAMTRADDALRALRAELDEGDALTQASSEVLSAATGDGVRLAVRDSGRPEWRQTSDPPPAEALALAAGACARELDSKGEPWCACADRIEGADAVAAIPVKEHRALLWTLGRTMALVVVAALLAVLWAARRAVRGAVESVAELARWTERLGEEVTMARVDLPSSRTPPTADTAEVARLVASFDRLVQRLFDALARERASSAHIAHELRTPLTSIRAELEALLPSPAIERVLADAKHLERVVDAILVLSAPRERRRHDEVVNVADLAREMAPPGTTVEAPDEALVDGDARLISLALQNLLDNAHKYSGHAARAVRVSREGEQARLAVLDDGPGADAEARDKMFDRYWRGSGDGEGSGLGLALVRAVAERHGGKAEAVPGASGKGLEVAMTLGKAVGWHD